MHKSQSIVWAVNGMSFNGQDSWIYNFQIKMFYPVIALLHVYCSLLQLDWNRQRECEAVPDGWFPQFWTNSQCNFWQSSSMLSDCISQYLLHWKSYLSCHHVGKVYPCWWKIQYLSIIKDWECYMNTSPLLSLLILLIICVTPTIIF